MVAPAGKYQSLRSGLADLGLLVLRVGFGGMLLRGHGWDKLQSYADLKTTFPDPIGIGSHMSLLGAIFAEVVCAALIIIGLATRLAGLVLAFTFAVAAFIVHQNDPLFSQTPPSKEPALMYMCAGLALALLGAGRISFDHLIAGRPLRAAKYEKPAV